MEVKTRESMEAELNDVVRQVREQLVARRPDVTLKDDYSVVFPELGGSDNYVYLRPMAWKPNGFYGRSVMGRITIHLGYRKMRDFRTGSNGVRKAWPIADIVNYVLEQVAWWSDYHARQKTLGATLAETKAKFQPLADAHLDVEVDNYKLARTGFNTYARDDESIADVELKISASGTTADLTLSNLTTRQAIQIINQVKGLSLPLPEES